MNKNHLFRESDSALYGTAPIITRRRVWNSRLFSSLSVVALFSLSAPLLNGQAFTSASTSLRSGQTARLSVVNNGRTSESETLTISDSAGAVLATQTFLLAPGTAARLDYVATSNVGDIYGAIIPCFFPADLQIIDSRTQRTLGVVESFLPPPPPSGSVSR